ncbi:MAG: DUF262 domain-containing protein [Alloprevotella sp.]
MILKGNIVLPEYQRTFVWNKDDYTNLIDSFKEKQFIPPVTIGAYKTTNGQDNLIIDGQQRLTSVFLAYIERFPKKEAGTGNIENLVNENDDDSDDDEQENMIEWTFKDLLAKGNKKGKIIAKCPQEKYEILDHLDDDFFNKNFLGFAYIVPSMSTEEEQQKFFSTLFRNINIRGKSLYVLESRASLYFLNHQLKEWFNPEFCKEISSSIVDKSRKSSMDYVRYVALLSQYKKKGSERGIGYGYASKMENYYETYIYSVVGNKDSIIFGKFSDIFTDKNYKPYLDEIDRLITELNYRRRFQSIIDLDLYFFGLIYFTAFEKRVLDTSRKDALEEELKNAINDIKGNGLHTKSPACLKYLRERIFKSIEIYQKYLN